MAENTVESIVKDPVAKAAEKAADTTDSLPPITKEPEATAEASMVPSVPAPPTTTDAPVAPSSDAAAKAEEEAPEEAPAAEAREDSANKSSEPETTALEPEKPSDSASAPEPQLATTEIAASGAESNAPAGLDEAVEPPKPASLEEARNEDLADKTPSEPEKPMDEAPKTDTSAATESGGVATSNKRKAEAVDDTAEANSVDTETTEPPEKKPKTNGTATNGAPRKPGRPRKDKNSVAPVGRTARKTRSQGAAD
ncbi:hypothetical protein GGR58DRAFT_475158 [Xylaria digitata]|nr:hypothetical protein GGR58DRAFT_475158 [Xylaria digitata]